MAYSAADARADGKRRSAQAFWWRMTDNLFRRFGWYLLPVLLLSALGVVQAGKTLELYQTTGTLSASSNPLAPDLPAAGVNAQFWETPAAAASRTINEQLSTDAFLEGVADRAGLGDAIRSGFLSLDVVRTSVWSFSDGTSLVKINASWADPTTSFELANGVISEYTEYLADAVASDSSEAVTFYRSQLGTYETEVVNAQNALTAFLQQPGVASEDRSVVLDLELTRLTEAVTAAEAKVANTRNSIEAAELAVAQSKSAAGRSLTVIDEPKMPTAPESTVVDRAVTVISFAMLGVVIAVGALLVSTVLDHSVASLTDLEAFDAVAIAVPVPTLRLASPESPRRPRSQRASRRAQRSHPSQNEPEKVDA